MATIPVRDANDNIVDLEKPLVPGRKSGALSRPVVLSNEDLAKFDAILAKVSSEAKQDTANTSLTAILAEAIAAAEPYSPYDPQPVAVYSRLIDLGYFRISALSTAAAFASVPEGATCALVQAETQDVRWRGDGVDPSTTVGMLLGAGTAWVFTASPVGLANLKFIEVTASAKINVTFYQEIGG